MTTASRGSRERVARVAPPVALLVMLSAFGPVTTDVYLPSLPGIERDLGASPAGVQLTLTACVLGLAVGQLVIGPLSDAVGRRAPLMLGLALFATASAGCALAPSAALLDLARAAQGAAGAAGIVIARAMVRDAHADREVARVNATLGAVMALAPTLAPAVGGTLLRVTDWRGIFGALAVWGVLLLLWSVRSAPETLATDQRTPGHLGAVTRGFHELVRDRAFIGPALCGSLSFGALFTYIAASSFVVQGRLGLGPQAYALVFGVNGACLFAVAVLNRRMVDAKGARRLLAIGLGGLSVGSVALVVLGLSGAPRGVVLVALAATVAVNGLIGANCVTLGMMRAGARAGSAAALIGILQFGVAALAAPLTGVLDPSVAAMGAVMAMFAFLAFAVRPRAAATAPRAAATSGRATT